VPEEVHESVRLDAGMEEVWELLMDPTRLGEWVSTHRSVDEVPELPLQTGSRFRQKLGVGPVRFSVVWEVVEAQAPEFARWRGEGPGGSTAEVTYRLTSEDGATRFDYINDYDLPGGFAGRAAKKAVSAAGGRREARRSLRALGELFGRA
jgi:uncharacterized protein YndB with AHSA1/START domain